MSTSNKSIGLHKIYSNTVAVGGQCQNVIAFIIN